VPTPGATPPLPHMSSCCGA